MVLRNTLFFAVLLLATKVHAVPITFEFVCSSGFCAFDPSFAFEVTLDSSVITASGGYSTGSDAEAGFLGFSWSTAQVGGLSVTGTSADVDMIGPYVGFGFDGAGILNGIWDTDVATNTLPFTGGGADLSFGSSPLASS